MKFAHVYFIIPRILSGDSTTTHVYDVRVRYLLFMYLFRSLLGYVD
jgi:hypothetical protein